MIKVCDSIMGSGKSSAAINYINSHKRKKFIYVTPFLDETVRIQGACPDHHFIKPSNRSPEFGFSKKSHTAELIKQGKNITTTHQAFRMYDLDMLDDIRKHHYTLIIDEALEVLDQYSLDSDDMHLLLASGYVEDRGGKIYPSSSKKYAGVAFKELFEKMNARGAVESGDTDVELNSCVYWLLPPSLLTSFDDVIIMTYMFDTHEMRCMLEVNHLDYEYIYVKNSGGRFEFSDKKQPAPAYVRNIKSLVNICDSEKLNAVGDDMYALSMSWFKSCDDGVEILKKHMYNYIRNVTMARGSDVIWSTYSGYKDRLKGKGYSTSFLQFCSRATNEYADRTTCIYAVNVFMNVGVRLYCKRHGVDIDDDRYALSVMSQWLWRSAIRNGKPINVYIPSKRMRGILVDWLDRLANGGES